MTEGDPTPIEVTLVERLVLNMMAADNALSAALKNPVVMGSKKQEGRAPRASRFAARLRNPSSSVLAVELMLTPRAKRRGSARKSVGGANDGFDALDELAAKRHRR